MNQSLIFQSQNLVIVFLHLSKCKNDEVSGRSSHLILGQSV